MGDGSIEQKFFVSSFQEISMFFFEKKNQKTFASFAVSTYRALKGDRQQLLGFDGEFHWQLLQHLPAETVDDHAHRVFFRQAALAAIEQLVLGDL
jgi:hypothetical protein